MSGHPDVHIVPSLSAHDGVGSYAKLLALKLGEISGRSALFIVAKPGDPAESITACHAPNASKLATALKEADPGAVIVHLSHYGYEKRGLSLWLIDGIRRAIGERELSYPVCTVFHELFAKGPPTTSAFYASPVHRYITRTLLDVSATGVVTTQDRLTQLRTWRPEASLQLFPVFSNVGEIANPVAIDDRPRTAIVFGSSHVRAGLYSVEMRASLTQAIAQLGVDTVVDIGPDRDLAPQTIGAVQVHAEGPLPASAVSKALAAARFGFVRYPRNELGKSGIVAGYAAHGVIPVVFSSALADLRVTATPGILDGNDLQNHSHRDLSELQGALVEWYAQHSLDRQAAFWALTLEAYGRR